jgi:hypothetical protein
MGLGMDRTAPRLQPEKALGMTEIRSIPKKRRRMAIYCPGMKKNS